MDEGRTISVREALIGINQLIDEDANKGAEPPPVNAEPMTRHSRTFGAATELKRDQLQKFRAAASPRRMTSATRLVQRGEESLTRTAPLDFAREWQGRHKRKLTSDFDLLVLIGACVDGSGINASDTLKNENFATCRAQAAAEWLQKNGPDQTTRNAASRAVSIFTTWQAGQAEAATGFAVR